MKVICGYNVNIDAVHNVSGGEIFRLINEKCLNPKPRLPEKISCLEDLLSGLLFCMKNGSGAELLIDDSETADLIGESFAWEFRLGGNAGNMANVLAGLGAEPVLNVPSLTSRQASFLHPGVKVAENGRLKIARLSARDGKDLIHFVFQFSAGEKVAVPEETVVSPRENRFIASFDSLNRGLYADSDFNKYCQEHLGEMAGALVSGFHMVASPGLGKAIHQRITQIASWKERRPEIYIHCEMGSFQRPQIMGCLLERLSAAVDSIGMNEDELAMLCSFEPGRRGIMQAAGDLRSRLGVARVCIHTREYVVSAVRGLIKPEEEIFALEQGTGLAATLAATGNVKGMMPALEVNTAGASFVGDFCRDGAKRFGRGAYLIRDGDFLCLVPALDVVRPKMTVGLGDSMTAATFFHELQARQCLSSERLV